MKVLVTGGAGFIGRNVVAALLARNDEVVVVDTLFRGSPLPLHSNLTVINGDYTSKQLLPFEVGNVDAVIHAACINIVDAIEYPELEVMTNVAGVPGLIQYCEQVGAYLVHLSSCSVYGRRGDLPITETAHLDPFCNYSAGKLGGEAYVRASQLDGFVNSTILRLSNCYGPGQDPARQPGVVGTWINNKLRQRTSKLFGSGDSLRDYVYVEDAVRAILMAVGSNVKGPLNISTGVGTSLFHLGDLIGGDYEYHEPRSLDRVDARVIDPSLAHNRLGWKARIGLEDGLARTEQWLAERLEVPDAHQPPA